MLLVQDQYLKISYTDILVLRETKRHTKFAFILMTEGYIFSGESLWVNANGAVPNCI